MIRDVEHLWKIPIDHACVFIEEMCIQAFCPLLIALFVTELGKFLYILSIKPLSDIQCVDILSESVGWRFSWLFPGAHSTALS